jgi:hypothetical protein
MASMTTTTTTVKTAPPEKPVFRVMACNTASMLGGQILIKIFAFIFNVYLVRRLDDAYSTRCVH